ncbi:MAG: hypothetical protein WA154_11760 [Moraxellaceae bacterium]
MNAYDLLILAHGYGVEVSTNGEKLKVQFDQSRPPPANLIDLLRNHKADLLTHLASQPANSSPYQLEPELSAARIRMEQALFVLRECELIEQERKRQYIPREWIDRGEWLELCAKRLRWSADDCTDALLALTQAKRIEIHHSERGIREVCQ